jgi:hypothetical protein
VLAENIINRNLVRFRNQFIAITAQNKRVPNNLSFMISRRGWPIRCFVEYKAENGQTRKTPADTRGGVGYQGYLWQIAFRVSYFIGDFPLPSLPAVL